MVRKPGQGKEDQNPLTTPTEAITTAIMIMMPRTIPQHIHLRLLLCDFFTDCKCLIPVCTYSALRATCTKSASSVELRHTLGMRMMDVHLHTNKRYDTIYDISWFNYASVVKTIIAQKQQTGNQRRERTKQERRERKRVKHTEYMLYARAIWHQHTQIKRRCAWWRQSESSIMV